MARVLVVDDYPAIVTMLRLVLMSAGHEVMTAENGLTGLGVARRHKPDLVLLDVDMPVMDGVAVCGTLKRNPATARIPVLLMTGRMCAGVSERAKGAGALGVLAKPFVRARLLEEVERALSEAGASG